MSDLILTNPDLFPDETVLQDLLKDKYKIYITIKERMLEINSDLSFDWNYYKDGKSWLCKVTLKKKTVFWLSLWDDCIKVAFYFSGKKKDAFMESDIKDVYKQQLQDAKPIGKLSPLNFEFPNDKNIEDLAAVAALKIKLKL